MHMNLGGNICCVQTAGTQLIAGRVQKTIASAEAAISGLTSCDCPRTDRGGGGERWQRDIIILGRKLNDPIASRVLLDM